MPAPAGNKYNEKWTLETTNELFDKILTYIEDNKKCRSISEAIVEVGEYEELVMYLEKKFAGEDFKSIKKARDICKNRLVNQGLDGEANTTMAIFILKNNHGFKDKTDVTSGDKPIESIQPVTIKFIDTNEDEEDEDDI